MEPKNLEIGEGDLTLQFEGEDTPTNVGICENFRLNIQSQDLDVYTGQALDPIQNFNIGRTLEAKIILKEMTLRNIVIASGGDPADIDTQSEPGKEIYQFPGNSVSTPAFAELVYSVPNVNNKTKKSEVVFYRAKSVGNAEFAYVKDKERFVEVTFRAYADPDNDYSPGTISRELIP